MSNLQACGLISLSTLEAFIDQMQQSYKENPYHCWRHAVDVLHTTYVMINLAWDFIEEHLRAIDLFSLMVGALAHDMHHTGVSNLFLCRTEHALAIAYNDKSVQENMHAASLFRLCLEVRTLTTST